MYMLMLEWARRTHNAPRFFHTFFSSFNTHQTIVCSSDMIYLCFAMLTQKTQFPNWKCPFFYLFHSLSFCIFGRFNLCVFVVNRGDVRSEVWETANGTRNYFWAWRQKLRVQQKGHRQIDRFEVTDTDTVILTYLLHFYQNDIYLIFFLLVLFRM